jgi:hypothetical protein
VSETPAEETIVTRYAFRPKLVGGDVMCSLGEHSALFMVGFRETRVAYPMIARVRLSYRPSNMSMKRYLMEIWPRGGIRVDVASVSFLPSLEVRDHAKEYRRFVIELHRKIAQARGDCVFEAGFPAWRWWPLAAVGVAAAIAGAIIMFLALTGGQWLASLVIAGVGGFFLWQVWAMVMRNRPATYTPDAIPEYVLPKA